MNNEYFYIFEFISVILLAVSETLPYMKSIKSNGILQSVISVITSTKKNETFSATIQDETQLLIGNQDSSGHQDSSGQLLERVTNLHITVANATITIGNGTVTVPNATVTLPDGTFTLPDATVTLPDATVTLPDATVTMPDGTFTVPNCGGINVNATNIQLDIRSKRIVTQPVYENV